MDKAAIRTQIEQEIAKTKQKIIDYEEMSSPISPDDAIGRVSRMDAINNKSVTEAALRQAKDKLGKLEYALQHLDDDKFGQCRRCGNAIPVMRVVLMPESPYCVHCAR
ncbi:MAG: TraR/DksA family transcriptional regulator [Bacteroidetes bacterium]|nr:MAG: TraR/DksA family transcriptional regulator [Bacteroidota bacterium]